MLCFTRLQSFTAKLTQFDIRAGLAAFVGVQDQKANFEEEAVRGHIETTHLVEAVAAHHQCNEAYSFTQHVDVMNNPIDSCLGDMKNIADITMLEIHSIITVDLEINAIN